MATVTHSPYSRDVAPCDFFLFPKIKKNLKEKRFQDVEEIKKKSLGALYAISSE